MELQKIYDSDNTMLTAFAESRIGGRPENQDSYGWQETPFGYLVTVCDGMGGGPGGKAASTIAVKEIVKGINEASKDEETSNVIIKAIRKANLAIIKAGEEKPEYKGMGSTATVLLISEKSAFVAHVGDSRVYQVRGSHKVFRTFDHSLVFEMVEQGVITEEQARLSAQSNVITRALGIKSEVEVDVVELPYESGDRFVLCSDGIHGAMPESKLLSMVSSRKATLGAITDDIATFVDDLGRSSGGGHDNLTIAIVETKINSILKTKMSRTIKTLLCVLTFLLLCSLALNISQGCGHGRSYDTAVSDSVAIWKDSLSKQAATISDLKGSIQKIDTISGRINRENYLEQVKAINKIVKQNK